MIIILNEYFPFVLQFNIVKSILILTVIFHETENFFLISNRAIKNKY